MSDEFSLANIRVTITDRKRMKVARTWRVSCQLPDDEILASVLTGMIETQVGCRLTVPTKEGQFLEVEEDPMVIEDVATSKGQNKFFTLVLETCYEYQGGIAGTLTAMVGKDGRLTLTPSNPKPAPAHGSRQGPPKPTPPTRDPVTAESLKSLHVAFFQNSLFHDYLTHKTGRASDPIATPDQCKEAFKALVGVESCKELTETRYREFISGFNQWIQEVR